MAKTRAKKRAMREAWQVCDICGKSIMSYAHDASPILENGCCCSRCHDEIVAPARFAQAVATVASIIPYRDGGKFV